MADQSVLACIVEALEAGRGFELACLDEATLRAAWDACDGGGWMLRLLLAVDPTRANTAVVVRIHTEGMHMHLDVDARHRQICAAIRAEVACPTVDEVRTAAARRVRRTG